LQELSRHRVASLSVKSTRYTLKELKAEEQFSFNDLDRVDKYIVLTSSDDVNRASIEALNRTQSLLKGGYPGFGKMLYPKSLLKTWGLTLGHKIVRRLKNFLKILEPS